MSLLKKALTLLTGNPNRGLSARPFRKMTERDLIELEAEIGKDIFGPVPAGHRREFFCLDKQTWVWYEEWIDVDTGKPKSITTRYEVQQNGILKVQDGASYKYLDGDELQHFGVAVRLYYERVMRGIYKRDPYTGKLLTEVPDTI